MSQTVTFTLDGANLYSAFRGARLAKSTNTTIPNTGTMYIPWEIVDRDTGGNSWAPVNPTKLVCTEAGNVVVRAGIMWQHPGSGQGVVTIKKNGLVLPGTGRSTQDFTSANNSSFTITTATIDVQSADVFEVEISNNSPGNIDLMANSFSWFELQYAEGVRGPVGATGPVGPAGQADLSVKVQSLMNAGLTSMCTHSAQAFIMQDGTVKTCGNPYAGNLGTGTAENAQLRPVALSFNNEAIGAVKSVVYNMHGGHALTTNGDVWAWGYNGVGQVGDGTCTTRFRPVPLNWGSYTKPKIIKLVCTTRDEIISYNNTAWYALDDTGQVWSWGYNNYGQLAIGNQVTQLQPYKTNITGVVDIEATGGGYSGGVFALKGNGTVFSAGYNYLGILGYAGGSSNVWKQVNLPAPCVKVRSTGTYMSDGGGYGHSLYLLADGRVFASGYNGCGQCGDGTTASINGDPKEINFISGIVDIWAGGGYYGHSFALNSSGDFFVWGYNGYGQLGIGNTSGGETRPKPNPVKNVKSVKLGGWNSYNYTVLLTQSGFVYTAGFNNYGQLGLGLVGEQPNPAYTHTPVLLPQDVQGTITEIGVSGNSDCTATQMLDSNGNVWTCGHNGSTHHLGANPTFGSCHSMSSKVMF